MSRVEFKERKIFIDGVPTQILSGAIHYFRVHRELWRDRLEKLALCGFNCLETYMCWNLHEPHEGEFDFSGMLDFVRFVKTAQELGLYVILRPGPYICAEWDNGGLPHWLMTKQGIGFRRCNKVYLECVQRYFDRIFPLIKPLQYDEGGPVIAMQIENEYGSYGHDDEYMSALREMTLSAGITVPLFTADGAGVNYLLNGMLPGTAAMLTGGSRAMQGFELLRSLRPDDPPFYMEFWLGWFENWKNPSRHTRSAEEVAREFDDIVRSGGNVNMYMFHGGTNFGFTAGANKASKDAEYTCDTTSYDYDAPITEWGDVTPKYFKLQEVVKKYFPEARTGIPAPVKRRSYGKIDFTGSISIFEALDQISSPVDSKAPLTMEELDQAFGFVHYRTRLAGPRPGNLEVPLAGDCADFFVNGRKLGTIFREEKKEGLPFTIPEEGAVIDVLVENFGRVNYGFLTGKDAKGLPEGLFSWGAALFDWQNRALPMDNLEKLQFGPLRSNLEVPSFFKGEFEVDEIAESFIRFPGSRGVIWVNGFNLGRYWRKGSTQTLYLPSPILKKGKNEIIVFETEMLLAPYAESVDTAIL